MVQSHLSTLNHKLFKLIYQLFLTLYQKNYLILQQIVFLATPYVVSEDFFILAFRFHFMSQGSISSHISTFKLINSKLLSSDF